MPSAPSRRGRADAYRTDVGGGGARSRLPRPGPSPPNRTTREAPMATVYFDEATRRFSKDEAPAVDGITLDIADGRGLVDGHDQKGVRPRDRDIDMVFQSYALYPNMTAAQNMAFALDNSRVSKAETRQRVAEAAKILELEQLLDRKPGQMSGGQRQRVAMGRAIVRNPKVFCMDEPLSNLDAKLRVSTRSQIAGLQRRLGITTVYVTHDQVEAMTMGHRVAVLRDGKLQQVDTPERLYDHPVNTFVAAFIGSPAISLVESDIREGVARVHGVDVPLDRAVAGRAGEKVVVGLRPESWHVVGAPAQGSGATSLALNVELVESLGAESFVYGRPVDADETADRVTVRLDKRTHLQVGDVVHVEPNRREVHLFDAASGERIEA